MYSPIGYADTGGGAMSLSRASSRASSRSRAASDAGYSSDGDMSSVYGAYSLYKPRNHKQRRLLSPEYAVPPSDGAWTKSTRPPSLSLTSVKLILLISSFILSTATASYTKPP